MYVNNTNSYTFIDCSIMDQVLIMTRYNRVYYCFHFIEEETEAQKILVIYSVSQKNVEELKTTI